MLDDISVCHMQHDMLLLRIIIFGMCYACLAMLWNKSNCIYYVVIQPVVLTKCCMLSLDCKCWFAGTQSYDNEIQ